MAASRERVIQNAERYVSRGKIESAIKEYRKLLADNPNDISTLNRVGDLYARINRNSEAIDLFTQIATQYADDGFFVKAIAIYKKIIKLDPTLLEVYESLADLYHRQGLVNEARTQYQVLADYYVKHGRTMAAIGIYRRMADLEPDDPSHHVKLAELYREEDRTEEAMGEYRAIADLMLHHGKGQEAARVFERALDVDAQDLGFITDAVLKLKEGGHVGPAAHLLAVAVEKNPKAERVARIAGLPERRAAGEAAAVRPAPEPEPEPALDAEAAPEAEAAEPPAPEEPGIEEPAAEVGEPALAAEEELPALEAEDAPFSLDLDEEGFESQVVPPPDMLEDRERPGAAWVEGARPAPQVSAEAEAPGLEEAAPEEPAAAAEPEPDAVREGHTGTFEFELDLDADGAELLTEVPEEAAARAEEPRDDDELDHELLERTAAEVHIAAHPEEGGEAEDLLAEAEVLAKYGIEEKALERLAELLQREPENLDAHRLMIGIHLEAGRHERVTALAGRFSELAERLDDGRVWPELRERLESAGYRVADGRVEPPPAEEAPEAAAEAVEAPADTELEAAPEAAAEAEVYELDLDADRYELPEIEWEAEEPEVAVPEPEATAPEQEEAVEGAEAAEPIPEEPVLEEAPTQPAAPEPPAEAPAKGPPRKKRRGLADLDAALAEIAGQFLRRKPRRAEAEEEADEEAEAPAAASEAETDEPVAAGPEAEPPVEPEAPPPEPEAPTPEPEAPPAFAPAAEAPPPDAVAPVDPLRALGDSLRAEIGGAAAEELPSEEPAAAAAGPSGTDPDDTGMSWLDEVAAASGPEKVIPDETGFFDLGAELEQELSAEGELSEDDLLVGPSEQSLEEIVEGFKRGVAENLSPEDFDTHFNLGIAYREMGLLDEAIGEFQLAAKEPSYLVACASMLGLCFREKGLPELAVKWFRRGLEAPEISEEDRLGLLYDLGDAQAEAGERKAAYETFVDVYGVNTNYRDVVARLTELEPRR